ncbi:MAG TPA: VOC family protein [Cellulomonas sp.]
MRPLVQEIVLDCADPTALARFWGELLGVRWALMHDGWAVVDADPVLLAFQQVPEPKSSPKNRLHLDVQVDDAVRWAERALAAGARTVREPEVGPGGDGFVVLADPEDNEFCFVVDNAGTWRAAARAALDAAPDVQRWQTRHQ